MLLILLKESFVFAWQSLVVNKLRSFLSLLGITIGIFAIILVFTIVDSLENNLRNSIQSLGSNVVYIQKWPWLFGEGEYPWWKFINRPTPQYWELNEIQKRSKTAEAVAYRIGARKTIKYKSNNVQNAIVAGISQDFDKIRTFDLSEGRYFTQTETDAGYHETLIGAEIAKALFPNEEALGKQIKIAGYNATVIGVIKKEGESMIGRTLDYQALIPFNFARYIIDTRAETSDPTIYVKAKPNISNDEMKDELTGIIRGIHRLKPKTEEDFALNETSLISRGLDGLFDIVGAAGWIIGGFSILVGGFGIANIMFVSVRERTNLIGIQKSLGAKNLFILFQFLSESVLLSLIGGMIGLLLTYLITIFGKNIIDMDIGLSGTNIILGFTISVLIGVISGFIPAYSASQLDPVEAIRTN